MTNEAKAVAWQWREGPCHDGEWIDWRPLSRTEFERLETIFAGRETVYIAGRPPREDNDGWPTQIRALVPATEVERLEARIAELEATIARKDAVIDAFVMADSARAELSNQGGHSGDQGEEPWAYGRFGSGE